MRTRLFEALLVFLFSQGCVSDRDDRSRVWLNFSQGDNASHFSLALADKRASSVSADGPLVDGRREVTGSCNGELTELEDEAAASLFTPELLSHYETYAEPGIFYTEEAIDRRFAVRLDAWAPGSRAPRSLRLSFLPSADPDTQNMLMKLNELLRTMWASCNKMGPNPGLVEPWAY